MDQDPYTWPHEGHCGGLDADGLVITDIPHRGYGAVRLLNKDGRPVGDVLPAFGCLAAGKAGEVVPLHKHPGGQDWHVTEAIDN